MFCLVIISTATFINKCAFLEVLTFLNAMGSTLGDSGFEVTYLSNIRCKHFQSTFVEIKQLLKAHKCFLTSDRSILKRKEYVLPFPFMILLSSGSWVCCGVKRWVLQFRTSLLIWELEHHGSECDLTCSGDTSFSYSSFII